MKIIERTLTFLPNEVEKCWNILSRRVTGSDLSCNRIPLAAAERTEAGSHVGNVAIIQVRDDDGLDEDGGSQCRWGGVVRF